MSFRTLKTFLVTLSLVALAVTAQAQNKKKGDTIVTKPRLVVTKLKISEGEAFDVRGKASFTLTAVNSDGSMVGTVNYVLPEDARAKIAQITGKPLAQVPANLTQTDVVTELAKLTTCPVIHLDFKQMDLMPLGAKLHFNRYTLDVNEDSREMSTLICKMADQVKEARIIRGIVRRMNEIIAGVEPAQQGNE